MSARFSHAPVALVARKALAFGLASLPLLVASPAFAEDPATAEAPSMLGRPDAAKADEKASGKTVTVELQSSSARATIEKRVGTTSLAALPFSDTSFGSVSHWEHACVAPCELKLDPHYAYRVAGDGLTPSDSFALPRNKEKVTLSAEMGSSTGRLSGMALTAIGVGSALLGGTALVLSPVFESQDVGSKGFRTGVLAGGVVFLAAGVLEMGMGLYLWMSNGTTVRADHGVLAAKRDERPFKLTPSGVVF
jgi:hypothetical protein